MKSCRLGVMGIIAGLVCLLLVRPSDAVAEPQPPLQQMPPETEAPVETADDSSSIETKPTATVPEPRIRQGLSVWRDVELVRGSVSVKFDVYRPDDQRDLPLVLMIHGGAWSIGDKRSMGMQAKQLAAEGFVVVSTNYRLAPKHQFPAQLDDCEMVLQWLISGPLPLGSQRFRAMTKHYAMWGYSAGAQLAALLASKQTREGRPPVCCVAGGIPGDFLWVPEDSDMLAHVFGGTRAQIPDVYRNASPAERICKELCPFFLYHGTSDFIVPYAVGRRMHAKLESAGVEAELLEVPGKEHFLAFVDSTARRRAIAFIKEKFRAAEKDR